MQIIASTEHSAATGAVVRAGRSRRLKRNFVTTRGKNPTDLALGIFEIPQGISRWSNQAVEARAEEAYVAMVCTPKGMVPENLLLTEKEFNMAEKIKLPVSKRPWRKLPCPACREKGFLKDFLNGFPGEEMDESKHIYGGCLPEYWSRAEVACVKCSWEGSKDEVRDFATPLATFSARFLDALAHSNFHHAKHSRKVASIAFMSHPIGVAELIIEAGGAEDLAIAG